ncbi:MAG: precorrin-6A reductase [Oscillospiraceae bacterium]|nr:precorrin-6A reductase [Oscillospiraceae bacterium]
MRKILIFGGTTEGRELAGWCVSEGIAADVSVTTDYGAKLLGNGDMLNVFTGKLDCGEMKSLINSGNYAAVIDATHPYAAEATANIREACFGTGISYYRLTREECAISGTCAESLDELVIILNKTDKIILSTLGSKEFPVFTKVNSYKERVWFRVLPSRETAEMCVNCGIDETHLIAEKPPYSVEDNIRHIRQSGAEILVTKECGIKGGYPEKIEAAKICGIGTVTVKRPADNGYTFDELTEIIRKSI